MDDDRLISALVATLAGVLVGAALFVPFVAVSYRRRGGLTAWRFVAWAAFLVYFFAIWTYTLPPLPDPDLIRCVGAITDPMAVVRDLQAAFAGPGNPIRSPELQQLLLNVLLFVPLGFFVRGLLGRGLVTTVAIGFAVSLFVETTQLTGVWGVYPCAYRFFDVGDLMTNTLGALVGATLSLLVPRRLRGIAPTADAREPRPVTRRRRLLAVLCDVLGAGIVAAAVSVATQLVLEYIVGDHAAVVDGTIATLLSTGVVALAWLLLILATGRSVGDFAVELEYQGGRMPQTAARLVRFAAGIGGYHLLTLLPEDWSWVASWFAFVAVVLVLTTRRGRGLPGILTGRELVDARDR